MAELCPFKVGAKVASWPILGRKLAILATFFILPVISIDIKKGKPSWNSIGPKLTILASNKTTKNGHISKSHFAQVSFIKKPTPTVVHEFVLNFQNRRKYGFRKY